MTFKEQLETIFIPALEGMLKKEREHHWFLIRYAKDVQVSRFVRRSYLTTSHLQKRIKEYKDYLKSI